MDGDGEEDLAEDLDDATRAERIRLAESAVEDAQARLARAKAHVAGATLSVQVGCGVIGLCVK